MTRSHRRPNLDIPTLVCLEGQRTYARREAERFVQEAFRLAYGARIEGFMPTLMTLRSEAGALLAVLGLREPTHRPMFLEHYLAQPVEHVLGVALDGRVARGALIEVGNFAVGAAGGGRWLITALTAFLHTAGHRWAVFTCGPELQNAFRRLGIELVDLGIADPARLPVAERVRWGTYYDQGPRVMAASVAQAHHALARQYGEACPLSALWNDALEAGRAAA